MQNSSNMIPLLLWIYHSHSDSTKTRNLFGKDWIMNSVDSNSDEFIIYKSVANSNPTTLAFSAKSQHPHKPQKWIRSLRMQALLQSIIHNSLNSFDLFSISCTQGMPAILLKPRDEITNTSQKKTKIGRNIYTPSTSICSWLASSVIFGITFHYFDVKLSTPPLVKFHVYHLILSKRPLPYDPIHVFLSLLKKCSSF